MLPREAGFRKRAIDRWYAGFFNAMIFRKQLYSTAVTCFLALLTKQRQYCPCSSWHHLQNGFDAAVTQSVIDWFHFDFIYAGPTLKFILVLPLGMGNSCPTFDLSNKNEIDTITFSLIKNCWVDAFFKMLLFNFVESIKQTLRTSWISHY